MFIDDNQKEVFDAVDAEWLNDALDPIDFITHLFMEDCSHKESLLEEIDLRINDLKEVRNKLFQQTSHKAVLLCGRGEAYLDNSNLISMNDLKCALDEVSPEDKVFIREEINRRLAE